MDFAMKEINGKDEKCSRTILQVDHFQSQVHRTLSCTLVLTSLVHSMSDIEMLLFATPALLCLLCLYGITAMGA